MNQKTDFKTRDLILALIIGEISAWLILALAESIVPDSASAKIALRLTAGSFLWMLPVVLPIIFGSCLYAAFAFSKGSPFIYQIAKYVLVGGLNTLLDWTVLALASRIALGTFGVAPSDLLSGAFSIGVTYYVLFKAISFVVAVSNSYPWNKFWTFGKKADNGAGREFLQFFILNLLSLFINVGVAALIFQSFLHVVLLTEIQWGILAAAMGTVVSTSWNFLGFKFIVFGHKLRSNFPSGPLPNARPCSTGSSTDKSFDSLA